MIMLILFGTGELKKNGEKSHRVRDPSRNGNKENWKREKSVGIRVRIIDKLSSARGLCNCRRKFCVESFGKDQGQETPRDGDERESDGRSQGMNNGLKEGVMEYSVERTYQMRQIRGQHSSESGERLAKSDALISAVRRENLTGKHVNAHEGARNRKLAQQPEVDMPLFRRHDNTEEGEAGDDVRAGNENLPAVFVHENRGEDVGGCFDEGHQHKVEVDVAGKVLGVEGEAEVDEGVHDPDVGHDEDVDYEHLVLPHLTTQVLETRGLFILRFDDISGTDISFRASDLVKPCFDLFGLLTRD